LTDACASLAEYSAVRPKKVSWKSRDGLAIEGVLFLPFDYQPGRRVPLLVELHGGPTGVVTDSFPVPRTYLPRPFWKRARDSGAELPRIGELRSEFRLKNIDSQGFGDFDDVMSGVDFLIDQGIADSNRLGVMGWSYGGFLTAWTIGHTDRFKAASVGAPATDWITYYGQSDGPRSTMMTYFGGTPWEKPEAYNRHSRAPGSPTFTRPRCCRWAGSTSTITAEIYWS